MDNDGDGRIDFAGVDNNGDGDFDDANEAPPDAGCFSATHYREAPDPQCADGQDNDGDGTADAEGVDLNGDGSFGGVGEFPPDASCASPGQADERSPEACRDGIDNDEDGFIDFQPQFLDGGVENPDFVTRDQDCIDPFDNSESR
mgnify:CR=1 FL=1